LTSAEPDAYDRVADVVLEACFADRDGALGLAVEHRRRLAARQRALDELRIAELHVTGGGNDLRIGLSPQARWIGASQETVSGQRFHCNLPSEESFTTPDRRRTRGRLVASRPFRTAAGLLVEGLKLEFRDGRVVDLDADRGKEGFAEWLAADDGAGYLGEVALVGQDSPVARSGLFFDLTLLDENAACHVALGDGIRTALAGGETMGAARLAAIGANRSRIHTDVMFGSPAVDVVATESRAGEVVLLAAGRWSERFR
jgi:aminopeptidase